MTLRSFSLLCAGAVAVAARWRWLPWPEPGVAPALDLLALRDPALYWAAWGWQWAYPAAAVAVCGSFAAAAWDVWGHRRRPRAVRAELPIWPLTTSEPEPAIVIGEQHHPVEAVEVPRPEWLTLPAKGLFTGVAVFGAIGSGKTSACMRPWCQQLFGWRADDPERRASGLVLEVKGDFCHQVRQVLDDCHRPGDYLELGLGGRWQWNPLDMPEVDSYSLAYQVASLLNQLFGKGKEPFWQQASTNLLRNLIELHRVQGSGWVTLQDLYRCAIDSGELARKLEAARSELRDADPAPRVSVSGADVVRHSGRLEPLGPWRPEDEGHVSAVSTLALEEVLDELGLERVRWHPEPPAAGGEGQGRLEAVERWLEHDWQKLDAKLQTSVVEGVSSFLGIFDQPDVAQVFCPGKPAASRAAEAASRPGTSAPSTPALLEPLPRMRDLIESGRVLALNMPGGSNPALSRAVGVMLKSAWLRAALGRPVDMAADPKRYWRPAVFVCDEYQQFATVGEDDPAGDEKSFALTRQSRVIPIVATQSLSSLRSVTRGDAWRTLLQCFRTRVFLSLSDNFSAQAASQMCGTVERLKASYSFSENTARAGVSLLSGRAGGARSSVGAGRSYQSRREAMFHPADFAALDSCQAVVLPFDGYRAGTARRVYLKPHWLPRDMPYFEAVRQGRL